MEEANEVGGGDSSPPFGTRPRNYSAEVGVACFRAHTLIHRERERVIKSARERRRRRSNEPVRGRLARPRERDGEEGDDGPQKRR